LETKAGKVQLFAENVDHTYRAVLSYVVVQEPRAAANLVLDPRYPY
jgi:hypothetical protein